MTDLKPCPFCGTAELFHQSGMVHCLSCDASAPIDSWNKRVALKKSPEEMSILQRLREIESKFGVMEDTIRDVDNLKEHVFKHEWKPDD